MTEWFVYILRCADDTLYTGITRDVERRLREHNGDNRRGAAYTRGRRPVDVIYREACSSRSQAARREHEIRAMTREDKEKLANSP
jgi:putative endonuclease